MPIRPGRRSLSRKSLTPKLIAQPATRNPQPPQVLPGALSVKEAMTYVARLRLRNYRGGPHAARVVDSLLGELGLTDVANSPIGIPWASDFEVPEDLFVKGPPHWDPNKGGLPSGVRRRVVSDSCNCACAGALCALRCWCGHLAAASAGPFWTSAAAGCSACACAAVLRAFTARLREC